MSTVLKFNNDSIITIYYYQVTVTFTNIKVNIVFIISNFPLVYVTEKEKHNTQK